MFTFHDQYKFNFLIWNLGLSTSVEPTTENVHVSVCPCVTKNYNTSSHRIFRIFVIKLGNNKRRIVKGGRGIGLASGVLGGLIFGVQRPLENYYRRSASVPLMASGVSKPLFLGVQRPHTEA